MAVHPPNTCDWRAIVIRVAEMLQACNMQLRRHFSRVQHRLCIVSPM